MAVTVIELHGDEKKYLDALNKVMQKNEELEKQLKAANKAASDTAAAVGSSFKQTEQDQDRVLSKLQAQLRQLGPEGQAAAQAMAKHLASGGQSSEVAIDGVIAKVREMSPALADAAAMGFQAVQMEAAEAARIMEAEAAEAAKYSEGAFAKPLDKLRQMGPEGRKAAEMLKAHLVEAGKIGERSMGDIIEELRKIDPEAAAAAEKIKGELETVAEEGSSSFDDLATSASGSLMTIAAGFMGLQQLIAEVNAALEKKKRLMAEAAELSDKTATTQAQAALNFATFDVPTQMKFLEKLPVQISKEMKFDDPNVVLNALSKVASTGESDPGKIEQAVRSAINISRHNPSEIPAFAETISDISGKAKVSPQAAASMLISAQQSFRGSEFKDLSQALPQTVSAIRSYSDKSITSDDVIARQATALLNASTISVTDRTALSSTTFVTSLAGQLDKFMGEIERNRIEARAKIEVIDRKIKKGKDTEKDRDDKRLAQEFLVASEGFKDPKDLFARLSSLRDNEGMREAFLAAASFEIRYKPAAKELLTSGSDTATGVDASFNSLRTDPELFKQTTELISGGTKELRAATASQEFKSNTILNSLRAKTDETLQSKIMEAYEKSQDQLFTGGFTEVLESKMASLRSTVFGESPLRGGTAAEKATDFILDLQTRSYFDRQQAGSMFGKPLRGLADRQRYSREQIETALRLLETNGRDLSPESGAAALSMLRERGNDPAVIEQMELFRRIEAALTKIAEHTQTTAANTSPSDSPTAPALSAAAGQ